MGDVAREMDWGPILEILNVGLIFCAVQITGWVSWEGQDDMEVKLAAPSGWAGSLGQNLGIAQLEQGP